MISHNRVKQLLEYEFGLRDFTPEAVYYLGLSSTDPATNITEPGPETNYARCAIDNNANNWGDVATGEFSLANKTAFSFNVLNQAYTPGVTHWFLSDTASGSNILYYGELAKSRPMPEDSQVIVNPGEMIIIRRNVE